MNTLAVVLAVALCAAVCVIAFLAGLSLGLRAASKEWCKLMREELDRRARG